MPANYKLRVPCVPPGSFIHSLIHSHNKHVMNSNKQTTVFIIDPIYPCPYNTGDQKGTDPDLKKLGVW